MFLRTPGLELVAAGKLYKWPSELQKVVTRPSSAGRPVGGHHCAPNAPGHVCTRPICNLPQNFKALTPCFMAVLQTCAQVWGGGRETNACQFNTRFQSCT